MWGLGLIQLHAIVIQYFMVFLFSESMFFHQPFWNRAVLVHHIIHRVRYPLLYSSFFLPDSAPAGIQSLEKHHWCLSFSITFTIWPEVCLQLQITDVMSAILILDLGLGLELGLSLGWTLIVIMLERASWQEIIQKIGWLYWWFKRLKPGTSTEVVNRVVRSKELGESVENESIWSIMMRWSTGIQSCTAL